MLTSRLPAFTRLLSLRDATVRVLTRATSADSDARSISEHFQLST